MHESVRKVSVKSVRIRSFSSPYFPAFGLNIQFERGKIQTRKTPYMDTFKVVCAFIALRKIAYVTATITSIPRLKYFLSEAPTFYKTKISLSFIFIN